MTPPKIVRQQGFALKSLPTGLSRPENGDWVVLSAEIPKEDERGGDIVRIEGMVCEEGLPMLAQHLPYAADGSPTNLGLWDQYKNSYADWNDKKVPAKLGRFEWAGTDFSRKYKELWPKFLNRCSIGAIIKDGKPLGDGGWDYIKTELIEASIVTIPANPAAGVMRTILQTLGIEESGAKSLEDILSSLNELSKVNKSLVERIDNLESYLVARSDAAEQTDDQQSQQQASDFLERLAERIRSS